MPYSTPSAADFKARYPEFTAVADASVAAVIQEAEGEAGTSWIDADRRPAVLAFAAHMLAAQGFAHAQMANGVLTPVSGPVKTTKVGDVMTTFGGHEGGAATKGADGDRASDLDATPYGQRFLELRRRSFPSGLVI